MAKRFRGFTLIELLAVITILGILATFAVFQVAGATKRANDAKRQNDLAAVKSALEVYYQDNTSYPVQSTTTATAASQVDTALATPLTGYFKGTLPADKKAGQFYRYVSDGTNYALYATLEFNTAKTTAPAGAPANCTLAVPTSANLGSGIINNTNAACFRVTNDN